MTTIEQAALAAASLRITPRIQSRVPFADYTSMPGMNITRLKELRRSPQHFLHRLTNPKASEPLTLGRASHVAVLEPERFDRDYAIWTRRTDAGKMAPRTGQHWETFLATVAAGREVLTEDEADEATRIALAVRAEPAAMKYLQQGDPEVTLQWQHLDRACKGRVDWLTTDDGPVLVGLKTARDCRHFVFATQAAKLGYHLQWAFYFDGYRAITGRPARMVEIVVENEAPHAVAIYTIPRDIVDQGRDEYYALLDQLEECERTDLWPGPGGGVEQELTLPSWVYGSTTDDLSEIGLETA